ncbi:MAG: hypothetical protein U0W24_20990 [Bacteroidales bacterium]
MKIVVKGKPLKVSDFINYLVENQSKQGKSYKIQLNCEDKYDKRMVLDKENLLKNKILVQHEDGFSVFENSELENPNGFNEKLQDLSAKKEVFSKVADGKFEKVLSQYQIHIVDGKEEWDFEFSFLNLLNEEKE